MRRALVLGSLVLSSAAFAVRVVGELRVFAGTDGSTADSTVVAFGADAGTSTFTVQNVGRSTVTVSSVTLLGDEAAFTLGTFPTVLNAAAEAQVSVSFHPAAPGSYAARVVIESDAPRNSELVLCAPAPCSPPMPPPESGAPAQGCASVGWLAPALAALWFARRRQPGR